MAYAMGRTPAKPQQVLEGQAEDDHRPEPPKVNNTMDERVKPPTTGSLGELELGATEAPHLAEESIDVRRLTGEWEKGLKPDEKQKTTSPPPKTKTKSNLWPKQVLPATTDTSISKTASTMAKTGVKGCLPSQGHQRQAKIAIFSDSRSALDAVANSSSTHPLAVRTRKHLRECALIQDKEVSLYWIKAHAGLEGNERADELAKEAARQQKTRHTYELCPVSFIKRCIRQRTIDEWDRRYNTEHTASVTKLFLPSAKTAFKIVRKMELGPKITQALTGHGGFSSYLNRFKCKESPSCECDPGEDETVEHLLTSCPIYATYRHDLT